MSWLEKVAPGWARDRERARLEIERIERVRESLSKGDRARRRAPGTEERMFDAASGGRRLGGWYTWGDGPHAQTLYLDVLRKRSRDLTRNNPHASAAVSAIVANLVGTGVQARFLSGSQTIRSAWTRWARSTDCDVAGRCDLPGLQALVVRSIVESGEVLVRRRIVPEMADRGLVPLQLQVLESEYLNTMASAAREKNRVIGGIEFDQKDRPVAYHLFTEHPDSADLGQAQESIRVPASEIILDFRIDRPGQVRGVPWGAPVMTRLRALDDYEDAALERARVAACFAAFVYDSVGDGYSPSDGVSDDSYPLSERVEPGIIEELPPGKDVKFGSPPPVSDYDPFTAANLRAIAAGYGVPYEVLTGDLSKTSFASARIGWLEFDRRLKAWRSAILVRQFLDRVWEWWLQAATVAGYATARASVEWTPPRREMLNPREEIDAAKALIRSGLSSWSDEVRARGEDPDGLAKEIAADFDRFDELGLVLDIDPRRTNMSGQQQGAANGSNDEPEPEPDDPEPEPDEPDDGGSDDE